jgi:uncharacterized protein
MTRIRRWIAANALFPLVALLLLGSPSLFHLADIRVNNGIDVWLDHHTPSYTEYREFQETYGGDEWMIAAFSLPGNGWRSHAGEIRSISRDLAGVHPKARTLSIADADDRVADALSPVLVSDDGGTAGILLDLSRLGVIDNRQEIVRKVEDALAPYTDRYDFHIGGPTLFNAELNRMSEHQFHIFLPLAFLTSLVCLFIVFRSLPYVLITAAVSAFAVAVTLGTAAGFGMTLNMISSALPALIWVLSLTGGIHLLHHFRRAYRPENPIGPALTDALKAVAAPYAIASLTTAAGFLSLMISHLAPVRNLGFWAAAGILVGFIANLALMPGALYLFSKFTMRGVRLTPSGGKASLRPPSFIADRRYAIVAAGVGVVIAASLLAPTLHVESNVLNFFKKESRIRRDYRFIADRLAGLSTIEMDCRGFPEECRAFVKKMKRRLSGIPGIEPVVYTDQGFIRISIFVQTVESVRFNRLVKKIRSIVEGLDTSWVQVRLTGSVVLLNSIEVELIRTQIRSFGLALLTVLAVLTLIFRSPGLVLAGGIVSIFPIAVLAGAAALMALPLNVATIMVASVAIGIAVDDSVFFLARLRMGPDGAEGETDAVRQAWADTAKPISATTLVTTVGFLVLTLGDFKPIAVFGGLSALAMTSAWIGDLVFLPGMLYVIGVNENNEKADEVEA